jgi:COMPASS component SWD2
MMVIKIVIIISNIIYFALDAIRYLSLHDNKYLRYFRGHTKRVTQLLLNPLNDAFISVAPEESLCLWDLRTTHMQGRLNLASGAEGSVIAAFDPQGLVFGVTTASKYIRLYDSRNWERGAFATFELTSADSSTAAWRDFIFSPDGKEILIQTTAPNAPGIVLDSFDGSVKGILEGSSTSAPPPSNVNMNMYSCLRYTPDSKFVIGGRSDGRLDVWNSTVVSDSPSRPIVENIEGIGSEPIRSLAFNPKFAMLATVGEGTVFYI